MSTTDPAITIAGMRAEIDALTSALRSSNAALASASTSAACRDATLARCDTERDALATALATRTAERDEALSALAAQSDVLANAAAKHGEELARVEGARATAVGLASDYKTRAEQLAAKVNAITSERDSALANLRACEARVARVEAESKATIEAAALRQRVADLEARPVLTVEAAVAAAKSAGWSSSASRDAETVVAAIIDKLGALTLPAQDRAEELNRAYESARLAYGVGVEAMRVALANLGAAPTTPPAEVFAGVSEDELIRLFYVVGSDGIDRGDQCPIDSTDRGGIRAVLARLKVSLVAPVDPEEVAQELAVRSGSPGTRPYTDATIRAALIAAGVPVTPERGQ